MIDSHAHLITQDIVAYPPAPIGGEPLAPGALDNHLTLEELRIGMKDLEIAKAVAVQRAHVYGYDNRYVLNAARSDPQRIAAVACVDALAADAGETARALRSAGVSGFRFSAPSLTTPGTDWFAGPHALGVWSAAESTGASLCLHVFRSNRDLCLDALWPLLELFSTVPVVLDHAGNPTLEEPDFGLAAVEPLAAFPQVFVKISTINFQQLGKIGGDPAAFTAAVVERFDEEHVMWGSDVAQSRGAYEEFVAAAHGAVAGLTPEARAAVLHGTADHVYFS